MAVLPDNFNYENTSDNTNDNTENDVITVADLKDTYPTRTYKVNFNTGQLEGFVDGLEAMKQAFYFAINTQRHLNLAFTSNFGMEWRDLIGKPNDYIISEILTRVQSMIKADSRFLSADYDEDEPFTIEGDKLIVNIVIQTEYGSFNTEITSTVG